jgi:hypothetical protein
MTEQTPDTRRGFVSGGLAELPATPPADLPPRADVLVRSVYRTLDGSYWRAQPATTREHPHWAQQRPVPQAKRATWLHTLRWIYWIGGFLVPVGIALAIHFGHIGFAAASLVGGFAWYQAQIEKDSYLGRTVPVDENGDYTEEPDLYGLVHNTRKNSDGSSDV